MTALNPQYKLGIIPLSKDTYHVLTLPQNLITKFISNHSILASEIKTQEKPTYITATINNSYVVIERDNLPKIARKFDISLAQLKKWNGLETDFLIEGQRLVISNKKSKAIQQHNSTAKVFTSTLEPQNPKSYTVKNGESLFLISKKFPNISIRQLRNWNNLWGVSYVKPGTVLEILTKSE